MKLTMFHGRLDPSTGATDEEGNPIDDWGFTGPELLNVTGFHVTYGQMRIYFATEADCMTAKAQTGWERGHEDRDLELPYPDGVDCLKIRNYARDRDEYFGDWDFIADNAGGCNG